MSERTGTTRASRRRFIVAGVLAALGGLGACAAMFAGSASASGTDIPFPGPLPIVAPSPPDSPTATNTPNPSPTGATPTPTNTPVGDITQTPPPTATPGIPPSFFGMTTVSSADFPRVPIGTLGKSALLTWAQTEPSPGHFDFTAIDSYMADAISHKLVDSTNTASMVLTFGSTPRWAAADPHSCTVTNGIAECTSGPADIQTWIDFITAVAGHYNGVTQPHIRYYELWNAANTSTFWTGSVSDLVNLANAAYSVLHHDSRSIVLTPSLTGPTGSASSDTDDSSSGTRWLARYLDAGGALYADGVAFHGYLADNTARPFPMPEDEAIPGCNAQSTCYGSITTRVTTLRKVLDEHGMKGKPLFDTEGSWGNGSITDPDVQAAWIARWYLLQAGLSATANLQLASWFSWGGRPAWNWGTIENDGLAPTGAGLAFAEMQRWLVGSTIAQPCSSTDGETWTCALSRPNGWSALAVWNTSGPSSYTPAQAFTDYRDLSGNVVSIDPGSPVDTDITPILLEQPPS